MIIKQFNNILISYREKTTDEQVLGWVYNSDLYFLGVPEYIPQENDVIIDVGAHIGAFSVLAANKAKKGKIYAIEPCRESYECLKRNIALNKLSNISAFNIALSDISGKTKLYHSSKTDNISSSITKKFRYGEEEVAAETLANFILNNNIDYCTFMKMNCEGAEFDILLTADKAILQKINLILVLYHLDMTDRYTEKDLIDHFIDCGFLTKLRYKTEKGGWVIAENTSYKKSFLMQIRFILNALKCNIYKFQKNVEANGLVGYLKHLISKARKLKPI